MKVKIDVSCKYWVGKEIDLPDDIAKQMMNKVGRSPSGALVSDIWVLDFDELAKLPKEEFEKQGEQKPVFEIKTPEESLGIDSDTYNKIVDECVYGEQKPAWSEEDKSQKELAETYLAVFDKHFPILPTLKGKQLADYKNFLNQCQQIFGLKYWGIHPTQARLFEKLSLLWAAWGVEYLKGLGQTDGDTDNEKQEWSEEDRIKCNACINLLESLIKEEYFDKKSDDAQVVSDLKFCCKDLVNWLKSIKDRVQPKPKQEWSEEDEYTLGETIQHLEELIRIEKVKHCGIDVQYYQRDIDWLKSLKERVQPQTKQEWSKEDEYYINDLIKYFSQNEKLENTKEDIVIWLKSIKERYTWKPSDEQIEILDMVLSNESMDDNVARILRDIREQLKKLK